MNTRVNAVMADENVRESSDFAEKHFTLNQRSSNVE
jgi:hypothetical protein